MFAIGNLRKKGGEGPGRGRQEAAGTLVKAFGVIWRLIRKGEKAPHRASEAKKSPAHLWAISGFMGYSNILPESGVLL